MRCFHHPELDAVGTCKVCNKGLCEACAADLGHSLACKGEHEALAESVHNLVLRNMQVQGVARKVSYAAPMLYAFMGLLFLVFGLRDGLQADRFEVYMGTGFLIFAVVVLQANRRAYRAQAGDAA